MVYVLLIISVVCEVFASSMLKLSYGFTRLLPSIGFAAGMGIAFYLLALVLQTLPLGVVYATWSGLGTILTTCIGVFYFREKMNKTNILGIVFLVIGILLMNLG
ncbi:DMT family transporter [Marinococcus luteus]|uniref:DMT family transporter n=1 Tax=Marinococcus luteus TaxID=1122204 RepID=UPI002ACC5153|nr:multidrug efflux SMR transporter [Marinococcus luteus]MDZ5782581.1 multidrug efflux SMR transporter [Marinococcus luteus]